MAREDGTTRAAQPGADRIVTHLAALYPGRNLGRLARDVADAIGIRPRAPQPVAQPAAPWDEREIIVVTYGDTLLDGDAPPLAVLGQDRKSVV